MLAESHHPPTIDWRLGGLLAVMLVAFAACSSPEEAAVELVERAWQARVTGDADSFRELVVSADRPHVEQSGAVLRVAGLDKATRMAMAKSLKVEASGASRGPDTILVDASITWLPPGPGGTVTDEYDYRAVKTDDGWLLDLGLETRAGVARKLSDARAAIRAGRPDEATRVLDSIDTDELPVSERTMTLDAVHATRDSVQSAGTLSKLRELMRAHHETEDPAERANLVKKARELGIESLELPRDVATLWAEANAASKVANEVHALGEKMRVEGEATKAGHGATITISVSNQNDVAVRQLEFHVDLIDGDGVRLHRVTHMFEGPVGAGKSTTTTVEAPSVPPAWDGALNVRLAAASR